VELETVLGVVASAVFVVRLLPQPVRLARTGVPDGVSPLMALNVALTEPAWLIYGLSAGLVPVWAVSLTALPLAVWTVVLLRRRISRLDLLGAGVWLAMLLLAWGVGIVGVMLTVSVVVNCAPQVWTALRSSDLEGVASTTWQLAIVDALCWGAYGLAVGDVALVGYTAVLLTSAVIILVRIAQTRRAVLSEPITLAAVADAA
jgi:uncharacterized protein with PQ loop repeat